MPRHSKDHVYIEKFFNRDRLAFNVVSKSGHMSSEQLKSMGIADSRMKNYVRDGLMKKVPYKMEGGKNGEAYKLTDQGRQLSGVNWGIRDHYHAQSAKHDMAIADKLLTLKEEEQFAWKTEEQLRDRVDNQIQDFKDRGEYETAKLYEDMLADHRISMPDGMYVNDQGIEVCFEVITSNYGEAELLSKEAAVQILGTQYETTRV